MSDPAKSKLAALVDGMGGEKKSRPTAEELDRHATLPKRDGEPDEEGFMQLNIRVPVSLGKRFKKEAKKHKGQAKALEDLLDTSDRFHGR